MDMEKINEKLNGFTEMVLKEASSKSDAVLKDAEREKKEKLQEQEIEFLKEAYRRIHEALAKIENESNSVYSGKLLEAKKTLYGKRNEITDRVFERVMKKLEIYRKTQDYSDTLRRFMEKALAEIGEGKVRLIVDDEDFTTASEIAAQFKREIEITKSDKKLLGGCIAINESSGLLADYSFKSRLEEQRKAFLEFSGLNVEL
ncbi:V-type ATP synthase subunit E [Thermoclostridium stercorarium subsp. stercorarium DSM 8532]|jgi:vacuolar-type H+-ATPase subunit E/Vma4|uniref:V-type ATP synthase subunit E n=3 Tax=Thermoclostridium stercorarium TaxID=1510 RepID=L7VRY8_THES1|nr:V-type ATP synthase subunit E family protein [Thermoclostridium stercorarium]AGC69414.1 V-type ATP synthase subunit E [Thermoclostridium stercorarium subsp. stercorarium DSM 8532]AGI40372.1 H+-ATPase subunit E [Thermoclostridium stercorarium subsp. stercorarium DSM 8532]ANW99663.1 ATP synthase subunit E [Thermoclostridium stercorarium subsp. thermolacticum DSM 2910]ANX02289.1 ATP synthase subunit E [Thermoclostridium stercorarium subsp. leptospartum DSM 9219]UZQ85368.1 V-type proton ATPase 